LPLLRGADPRRQAERRRRDPPWIRLPGRERRLRGGGGSGRARVRRPDAGGAAGRRGQARVEADRRGGGRSGRADGRAGRGRLYAEDPETFFPQSGRIERLRLPESIRVDAGVEEGDEVGVGYDPMIAKLIAHGATRDEALERLREALDETEVGGLVTNLPFLR